jgi:hypothetical protein
MGLAIEYTILPCHGSNHWPIYLNLDIKEGPKNRPFKFEAFWLEHPSFQANNTKWWKEASISNHSPMYRFQQRLKNLKLRLNLWNREEFGVTSSSQKRT